MASGSSVFVIRRRTWGARCTGAPCCTCLPDVASPFYFTLILKVLASTVGTDVQRKKLRETCNTLLSLYCTPSVPSLSIFAALQCGKKTLMQIAHQPRMDRTTHC